VAFQKGTDVAAVKYAVYQGRLDDGQVFSYADNIINGTETNAKTLGKDETVVAVSGLATGFYTLVAVAFDATTARDTRQYRSDMSPRVMTNQLTSMPV
jgi:hypothetical protein